MITCLSRTMDAGDLALLGDQLAQMDEDHVLPSAPHQQWEEALALYATERWKAAGCVEQHGYAADVHIGDLCHGGTPLADVITCLSVLEHVESPERFLYHLSCLLAPGGLLVLTFAFWNRCGPDLASGAHTRKRIYCPKEVTVLRQQAALLHLQPFGGVDPTWHGSQVDDHSIASLVLEKRR